MGYLISSSHIVSASASSDSHSSLAPAWVSSQMRQSFTNFSNESLPMGCSSSCTVPECHTPMGHSPLGTGSSGRVPCGVTGPASQPAPLWAPFFMVPRVLQGACSSVGLPQSLLWAATCCGRGSPCAADGCLLSHGSAWLRAQLPHAGLYSGLQGISAAASGSPHSLSSHWPRLLWGSFTHVFSLLSDCCCAQCISHIIKWIHYARGAATLGGRHSTNGLGLGQQQIHLGPGWHWLCWACRRPLAASQKPTPGAPPLPKLYHTNPVHRKRSSAPLSPLPFLRKLQRGHPSGFFSSNLTSPESSAAPYRTCPPVLPPALPSSKSFQGPSHLS